MDEKNLSSVLIAIFQKYPKFFILITLAIIALSAGTYIYFENKKLEVSMMQAGVTKKDTTEKKEVSTPSNSSDVEDKNPSEKNPRIERRKILPETEVAKKENESLDEFYQKILASDDTELLARNGYSAKDQGKFEDALRFFDKVLKLNPKNVNALIGKALTLNEQQNDDEAIAAFNQALAIEPNNIDALLGKGYVLNKQKKYQEALSTFEQVLKLDSTNADALVGKGEALAHL